MLTCNQIICINRKPNELNKIFFGDYDKLVRIDYLNNQAVRTLKESAEGNTWFVKQINYDRDIVGWESLDDVSKRMFLYNINYQNAMDSGVTNGFLDVMVPIITDPNWQLLYIRIGYEESIHSESYSYALINMFGSKASEYIDLVYSDPFIKRRLEKEIDAFGEVKEHILDAIPKLKLWNEIRDRIPEKERIEIEQEMISDLIKLDNKDNKIKIVNMIISNLYLEGIKFPLSFYVTWNINRQYGYPIQGIDSLLKEIAHDELNTHVPTGNLLLKTLRESEYQGFSDLWDEGIVQELAIKKVKHVIEVEDEWIDFLCQEGEIPGFTKDIGRHFIRYYADVRLKAIGVEPIYKENESDIIKWFKEYSNINLQNAALQEVDNTSYQKDGLVNDLDNYTVSKEVLNLLKNKLD